MAEPEVIMPGEGKSAVSSKTVIFNVLTVVAAVLTVLVAHADILSPKVMGWLMAAQGVVNILLRIFTDLPITGVFKAK